MEISFKVNCNTPEFIQNAKVNKYLNLTPLMKDTVSFGAMKRNEFEGLDSLFVNMFKPPLEKFNSKKDLYKWAQGRLEEKLELEQYSVKPEKLKVGKRVLDQNVQTVADAINKERMSILEEWKNYLTDKNGLYVNNPVLALIIFSAVVQEISEKNTKKPPFLEPEVLADTVKQIKTEIKEEEAKIAKAGGKQASVKFSYACNFGEEYKNNLIMQYMQGADNDDADATDTKWVKIPSKEHDPENFKRNIKRLKALSSGGWCTSNTHAETYLSEGDFHIYLEKLKPKASIRFVGNEIDEVQGEWNQGGISPKYFSIVSNYIRENHFEIAHNAYSKISFAKKQGVLAEAKSKLEGAIANLSEDSKNKEAAKTIFEYFGIEVEENEDKKLTISCYRQPNISCDLYASIKFEDLGIKEEDLIKNVTKISADANFEWSQLTSLGELKSIGGNADFRHSKVTSLGKLKSVGKDVYLEESLYAAKVDHWDFEKRNVAVGGEFK